MKKLIVIYIVSFLSCEKGKGISVNQSLKTNKSFERDLSKIIVKLDTVFLGNWEKMYVIGPYGGELKSILSCNPPTAQIEKIKKTSEKMNLSEGAIFLFFDKDNHSWEIMNPPIGIYPLKNLKNSCFSYTKESVCSAIVF